MNGKNVLKIWQLIILVVLLIGLLCTAFVPAFHYDADVVDDMHGYLVENLQDEDIKDEDKVVTIESDDIDSLEKDLSKDEKKKVEDDLDDKKKDEDIDVESISGMRIMSKTYDGIFNPSKEEEKKDDKDDDDDKDDKDDKDEKDDDKDKDDEDDKKKDKKDDKDEDKEDKEDKKDDKEEDKDESSMNGRLTLASVSTVLLAEPEAEEAQTEAEAASEETAAPAEDQTAGDETAAPAEDAAGDETAAPAEGEDATVAEGETEAAPDGETVEETKDDDEDDKDKDDKDDKDKDDDEDEDDDETKASKKLYDKVRLFLYLIYITGAIVLILLIVSFASKWSKVGPLVFSAIYSVFGIGAFAYMRWGLFGSPEDGFLAMVARRINYYEFENFKVTDVSEEISGLMAHIYGPAFIVGLIMCSVLLVFTIVSLVVGKAEEEVIDFGKDMDQEIAMPFEFQSPGGGDFSMKDTVDFSHAGVGKTVPQPPVNNMGILGTELDTIPVTMPKEVPVATAPKASEKPCGTVVVTKGVSNGTGLKLPEERKVIIGKSPAKTNLTIVYPKISNIHCTVRYVAARNVYIVKDHSKNGTFINGRRLNNGEAVECQPGTVLTLADGVNEVTLM